EPMVTGIFAEESLPLMKDMLVMLRGDETRLAEKPLAIFDACPSPPLKWSALTCQSVIDCARWGIPSEIISMPMAGATSPVTLAAALVQHTAENLSGVVISQLVKPGAPVIYGGSPSVLDMRKGTTPMGAIETMLLNSAYSQIGKRLGLPVHAYMGLSDAKILDAQAGLEGGMSILLAALAGINVVSGPGMLEFESCQSLEKLVIDDEICGMAYRLLEGIAQRDEPIATELLRDVKPDSHFLSSPHTLRWFREELYFPSIIERGTHGEWLKQGGKSLADKAAEKVEELLKKEVSPPLASDLQKGLRELALSESRTHGLEKLPLSE
ncbi:MAG: trimethylamine methyltransferase family protein, partial [Candidatus Aminicenantes bacterium]|nr:trimethylamine methyltransferase family protein [Candidatus Aminicenantes bacterium]